jgi:hypothetical protein
MFRLSLVFAAALALAAACGPSTPQPAQVRIAHLGADLLGSNGAVDLCLKPASAAVYDKRFFGGSGLTFPQLSSRTSLDAGTYSARIIPGGSSNCDASFGGLGDVGGIAFGEGGAYTLALLGLINGSGNTQIALKNFADDATAPAPTQVALRYVQASAEAGAVDVGITSGGFFTPLASNLSYPNTPNPPYALYNSAITSAVFAMVSPSGSGNVILQAQSNAVTIPGGSVDTLWVIGRPNQTGDGRLSFLLCADNGLGGCQRFP